MNSFSRLRELGANLPDRAKTRRAKGIQARCQTASEAAGGWGGLGFFCIALKRFAVILHGAWQPHCARVRCRSRQDELFRLSELLPKEHRLRRVLQVHAPGPYRGQESPAETPGGPGPQPATPGLLGTAHPCFPGSSGRSASLCSHQN